MPLIWNLITAEVMTTLALDELVEPVHEHECRAFGDAVSAAIRDEARWTPAQLEGLRFASAAMTMTLHAGMSSEPFGAMFVMGDSRSAIPADFPREALLLLLDWAVDLADPELRARFLDVIWVQAKTFSAATGAIQAYIESAKRIEDPKDWVPYVERLERALRIAASLGKGGASLLDGVLAEIEAAVVRHSGEDPLFLTYRLVGLLLEFGHGDPLALAHATTLAAERAEAAGDFWRAKDYFERVAECHAATKDSEARASALRRSAEALVKEAESAAATPTPGRGALAGAAILAQAIKAMRQAPGGKERAEELLDRLLSLQAKSLTEMKSVSTGGDASELVERALSAVRDKSFVDAVLSLCQMTRSPSLEALREQVQREASVAVLGSFITSDVINSRGRVVARAPALPQDEANPDDAGLRFRLYRHAQLGRSLTVQAMLNPARQEIAASHNPSRDDVVSLIQHSPWIPPGHIESFARALVAGFHADMLVATHLVPPQFEAMVRHVVERAGGVTSMFDPQGLQPEKSLNALLDCDEARRAFGEAGVFELQGLFVDQLGTNLRNEVAHGLLGDEGMFGTDTLFAWWLLLHYCVLTSRLVEQQASPSSAQGAGPETSTSRNA
jgi:hypothetical protein